MISEREIIARKIADRCCRRDIHNGSDVDNIVEECCEDLQVNIPEIIQCETLTRSFCAFYLRGRPYLIYDSCLMEVLYIYDSIILSENNEQDMEKLFYKLIGEELIRMNDLPRSLYFSGKYRNLNYSFDDNKERIEQNILQMVSLQSYFLIGHELTHLSLEASSSKGLPQDFWKFAKVSMQVLTERLIKDYPIDTFLKERAGYFLDTIPSSLKEYFDALWNSNRFRHFAEECYCDLMGLKLLLEHYRNPKDSVRAISAAINYLIFQEAVRSDVSDSGFFFGNIIHDVSRTMYFSVLRMEFLLIILQYNGHEHIEECFFEIQERSILTRYWTELIRKIPSEESFSVLSEEDLPNLDREQLVSVLIKTFYYAHIG